MHSRPPLVVMTSLCWDDELHKVMAAVETMIMIMLIMAAALLHHLAPSDFYAPLPSHTPRPTCPARACAALLPVVLLMVT